MVLKDLAVVYDVSLVSNSSIVGLYNFKGTLTNIYGIETALKEQPDLYELNSNIVGSVMPQSFFEYELEDGGTIIIGESWIDNTVPITNVITTINVVNIQPQQLELFRKMLKVYNLEYNITVQ